MTLFLQPKWPLAFLLLLGGLFNVGTSQALKYSALIGPRKNYLCEVENSGALFVYKQKYSTSRNFYEISIVKEVLSLTRRKANLEKNLRAYTRKYSRSSRSIRNQLAEIKLLLSALKHCGARGGIIFPGAVPTVKPCSVVEGESAITARIAKGTRCASTNSPVVLIQLFDSIGRDGGFCSGTVVGSHTILSAGHCFEDGNVRAAATVGGQVIVADEVMVHPQYSSSDDLFEVHDMSLLKFNGVLPVRPLPVVQDSSIRRGDAAIIAGFGEDENGGEGRLKAAKTVVAAINSDGIDIKFTEDGSTGNTCPGDSGGPILIYRNSKWVVAGVTSNGDATRCGAKDTSRFSNLGTSENLSFLNSNL